MKNKENLKVSLQRDLKYEIDMLNKSYNDILREFPLMLEVFLIHARLLNNFFYHKTSKYNDEVLAKDVTEAFVKDGDKVRRHLPADAGFRSRLLVRHSESP